MPVEILPVPKWFLVPIDKISYWAHRIRAALVLQPLKPKAINPRGFTRRAVPSGPKTSSAAKRRTRMGLVRRFRIDRYRAAVALEL